MDEAGAGTQPHGGSSGAMTTRGEHQVGQHQVGQHKQEHLANDAKKVGKSWESEG